MTYQDMIEELQELCHRENLKWWLDLEKPCQICNPPGGPRNPGDCRTCASLGYARKDRNVGEILMLCVSELAEALEAHRKSLPDDKLPHRPGLEVELADCLIRVLDLGGGMGLDIAGAFVEKMSFNSTREDHKIEARLGPGGKKY